MRYGNTPLLAALALAGVTVGCPAPGELDLSEWPAERAVGDESSPDTGSSTASADSGAVDAAMCVPTVDYFEQEVWTPFMSITCMACHVEGGIGARSSFLDLVEVNSAADLETNLAIVRQVASRKVEGTSVLLLKPIGGDGHSGGPIISEDSADYAALAELVARFDDPPVCDPADVDAGVGDTSEPVDTATAMDTNAPDTTAMDTAAPPDTPAPSEPQTWRFEGEGSGVQATTGRANDDAYNLWSNGELSVQIDIPHDGAYVIRARVWADQCCDELARMAVRLDGQDQSQFDVAATGMSQAEVVEHRIDGVRAARHTVGVAFLNDAYDPNAGYDRNLLVDWVEVEGPLP